jgi:hypothetical protein
MAGIHASTLKISLAIGHESEANALGPQTGLDYVSSSQADTWTC